MITTTIIAIVAILTTIWGFVERFAKKALAKLIEELHFSANQLKGDLAQVQSLLHEEKNALMREKIKTTELQKKVMDLESAPAPTEVRMSVASTIDAAALVDVTEEFAMNENDRAVFFEFYKDKMGSKELRWRLKAKNNKILADSGEGYGTKQNLKKALGVMLNAIANKEVKSRWKA